jgi:CheY-like chemotaxis protein
MFSRDYGRKYLELPRARTPEPENASTLRGIQVSGMTRPIYILLDFDLPGNISTRKLVLETAKLNVITVASHDEALATLARFPNVDGVIVNADFEGTDPGNFFKACKQIAPEVPTVVVGNSPSYKGGADHEVDNFSPQRLLAAVGELKKPHAEFVPN